MLQTLKDLARSKKALVALIAVIAWLGGRVGLHVDQDALLGAVTPLWAYVLAQGIADHGKEAAKIQAAAAKGGAS